MAPECSHEDLKFLGEDKGRNMYFRCSACGAVVVSDGVKTWAVPESPFDSK